MSAQTELSGLKRFLARAHVLTLCATQGDDMWCANAFYVFDPVIMAFDLMSSVGTRHGAMMAASARVAGTIARQTRKIERIQGVQYLGTIGRLSGATEAAARARYLAHFALTAAPPAPIWRIALLELKFTDNTQGFGHKTVWSRAMDTD